MLNATCASKTFFGSSWNDSRFTVCSCSSSMPFCPCSEAGSKTVGDNARLCRPFARAKPAKRELTAAGCATTQGPGCNSRRAFARVALDPGRADGGVGLIFERVGKIDDGASRIARGLPILAGRGRVRSEEREIQMVELLVRTLWMNVISSPMVSSWPRASSSSSNFTSTAGKLRSLRTSATSFPFSEAAPTMATR